MDTHLIMHKGWTYTKHGPGPTDHPMDRPWTTPNFQKEIAPVI